MKASSRRYGLREIYSGGFFLRFIGDYLLIFIGFGAVMYFLLPILSKRQLTAETRLRKTVWGAMLFTAAKFMIDVIFP